MPREVTVEEALQHRTYQDAIAGSRLARREVLKMIAKRERYLAAQHGRKRAFRQVEDRIEPHDPENADAALLILGIAERDPRQRRRPSTASICCSSPGRCRRRCAAAAAASASRKRRCPISSAVRAMPRLLRWPRGTRE